MVPSPGCPLASNCDRLPSRRAGAPLPPSRNIDFVARSSAQTALVLSADHVYRMDYGGLRSFHEARGAHLTIAVTDVGQARASQFGIVETDRHGRIGGFVEKPTAPRSTLASMGVYAFAPRALQVLLALDAARAGSSHDFGYDVIPLALQLGLRVYAYPFDSYWRDLGTPEAYWAASMDTLQGAGSPVSAAWPTVVRPEFASAGAGDVGAGARALGSVVFPGARIATGATVRDSVVLPGAVIARGAVVTRAIVDEGALIGAGARLGRALGEITVIGARTRVAAAPVRGAIAELLVAS